MDVNHETNLSIAHFKKLIYNLSMAKESLRVTANKAQTKKAMRLDPRSMSYSAIREMVDLKARSTESTVIYMEYDDCIVYESPAKIHEINKLPQMARRQAIQTITNNIAYSKETLIYSR